MDPNTMATIGLGLDIAGVLILLATTSQRVVSATLKIQVIDEGWIIPDPRTEHLVQQTRQGLAFYRTLYWTSILLLTAGFSLQIVAQWL